MSRVAEHDLSVRADVDQKLEGVAAVWPFGKNRASGVGADMAGDTGEEVDLAEPGVDVEVDGRCDHGAVGCQQERGLAKRRRIDAEDDVVHDRVADDGHVEHHVAVNPGLSDERADHFVECSPH